ncbi:MAG: hypothetical protein M1812_004484 [Candelaria pacifica]|nr:MAG: hypothetical protein M1812_004484 [Candelaria pacifica]
MNSFWTLCLFFFVVSGLPVPEDEGGDDCEVTWVTVRADATTSPRSDGRCGKDFGGATCDPNGNYGGCCSGPWGYCGSTPTHCLVAQGCQNGCTDGTPNPIASTNDTSSVNTASSNSTNSNPTPSTPDATSAVPASGDQVSAPVDSRAVPSDAVTYTPSDSKSFNCDDFNKWMTTRKADTPSKFLKVAPGTYEYMLGPIHPAGADPNLYPSSNIAIGFMPGGWTLDLRGVTFIIAVTPENKQQRPDQAIYINQSEDFTILGGTIWWDQGEQWSQATIKSIASNGDGGDPFVTLSIDEGYNTTAWTAMGPRNLGCMDISNPAHFTRPDCNFWYTSGYTFDFDNRKVTFRAGERANLKEGYVLYIQAGPNSLTTIASENSGGFHVKGMTSNGATAQYGLGSKSTAIYEEVYFVNPPPRPGFAPRVNGPTLSWGHINLPNFDAGGEASAIYKNSKWQYTGNKNDLLDSNTVELPAAGS